MTINAAHISYDLNGYSCSPFSASSASQAIGFLSDRIVPGDVETHFSYQTDIQDSTEFNCPKPRSIRSLLGGDEPSMVETYNAELEFDVWDVKAHSRRGSDRGVWIRYGKNMTDLNHEERDDEVYNGIYPYYYKEGGEEEEDILIEIPGRYLMADGEFGYVKIQPVDLSEYFNDTPDSDSLLEVAYLYLEAYGYGLPSVNTKVSFIQLSQSLEYSGHTSAETVYLGDTVHVSYTDIGVDTEARVVKTTYDAITGHFKEIELGEITGDLSKTLTEQRKRIEKAPTKSFLAEAIEAATSLITGGFGGYVVINSSDGSGKPDEVLIMNAPSIDTATKVWRWNSGGLGYSSHGYNGPYELALTMDGSIVASMITSGTLRGDLIEAGTITTAKLAFTPATQSEILYEINSFKDGLSIETVVDDTDEDKKRVLSFYANTTRDPITGVILSRELIGESLIAFDGLVSFSNLAAGSSTDEGYVGYTYINGGNIIANTLTVDMLKPNSRDHIVFASQTEEGLDIEGIEAEVVAGLTMLAFGDASGSLGTNITLFGDYLTFQHEGQIVFESDSVPVWRDQYGADHELMTDQNLTEQIESVIERMGNVAVFG